MGKVLSVLNRQINRFNAENRAHRILSKDKPIPAPKHPSTSKQINEYLSETTEIRNDLMMKHKQLDENLKKVYVISHRTVNEMLSKPSDMARLPKSRKTVEDSELGYQEPECIPVGYITLKQAMKILVDHQEDSKKYNASFFSSQYNLNAEDAENLLKYFSCFKIHIPEKAVIPGGKDKIFLRPAIAQEKQEVKKIDVQK
uniref:Hipothetical protein n=1 Tax=Panstrongylus megistus TaxID=65343 RepID=A0A069DPB5_9HEMI